MFEEFIKKVLDNAGYEDFKRGVRKTGRQIDLYAKHKVTGHLIICECKAHKDPIGAGDIHKFYGIYDKEYRQNDKLVGLFFSLSGFGSTAVAAYEEMSPDVKQRFLLRNSDFIVSMLRKAKVIASDDKLEHIITSKIKYGLGKRYLVYTRTGIYWIQLVLTDNKATHYIILGSKGEEVPAYVCSEIGSMDERLRNLKLLDIHAMKKILISLLDASSKTPEEISKDANECVETVMLSLQNLKAQNLLDEGKSRTYHLVKEPTAFIDLARQFLGGENETEFFLSTYVDEMINPSLISYCEQRFRLELSPQNKEALLRLLKISPSALREILFGPVEMYRATDEHLKKLNLPEVKRNKIKKNQANDFIGTLLRKLVVDLEKPSSKGILKKREIKGWRTQVTVDLAKLDGLYLSVKADGVIMILPATGKIERGHLVSVTDYDLFINIGLVLTILGKQKEAIECYDRAIIHLSDPAKLKAAWNNKGLSLAVLKKYDEAMKCYDHAIEIDSELKEAWYNKGRVYALKVEHMNAIDCYSKALEIDLNYSNALLAKQESLRLLES